MKSRTKKLELGLFVAVLLVLIAVWAVNGYEDTWLYLVAILIAAPTSWMYFRKSKD